MKKLRSLTRTMRAATVAATAAVWSLGGAYFARADEVVARAASPGNVIAVAVSLDGDGRVSYEVSRNGDPVIAPSRLGFILADKPKLDRNFSVENVVTSTFDDTWEQPWGERRFSRNHYNELRLDLVQKVYDNRHITVVFRLYDDGLGFRYEFPDQSQLKTVNIVEELTEFAVVEPSTAWWIPAGEWNRYEYLYNTTPLKEVSQVNTPLTIRTQSGLHVAFHEAALVDYASMWLRRVDGQRLKARLAPSHTGVSVVREAPFNTPWRTLQIARDAAGLYESDLILNLNEPNVLGDVSWVKPYKYVGIWWEMHLGTHTWGSGPNHGATTERTKTLIDFADKYGFRGVLVEGWNTGWDGNWFANGDEFSFTESYPDFDFAAVTDYARRKGVHLVGHHETAGNTAVYEPQMEAAFSMYAAAGVDSVKTGYVADAGGARVRGDDGSVHFAWNDGQAMSRHYLRVVTEAARHHIAINTHEPFKDTGLRRTYPNWVSREGARGMEYNAWGRPPNPPEHETILVFTRMLSGPMDFTPGILSLEGQGQPIASTQARQLALYVVLYSPIQMTADLPENYEKYPRLFRFIRDVPTDWSQTHVINGEVGDYVTIARKDRKSEDWYLGAITDETPRTLTVPLDFLEPGKIYEAQIYRDGDNAGLEGEARFDIAIESKKVKAGDILSIKLAAGGGQAIRFRAMR